MIIEEVLVSSIVPYNFNSKLHTAKQIDMIASSIVEFGFNVPVILDKQNILIAGHGRLEAAKKLKMKTIPAVRKDNLTESQVKALRVVDNKLAADTGYDLGNLELEIKSLVEMGYDSTAYHFEEFKFEPEPEPEEKEKDPEPEVAWVGQIKLKVPADILDSFESRLDELVREFEGITKETKRAK